MPAATQTRIRRAHPKTKYGCSTCKKRRIKCDERRPSCENCTKRGLDCGYYILQPSVCVSACPFSTQEDKSPFKVHVFAQNSESPSLSPPPSISPNIVTDIFPDCPDAFRPRCQELLHHFTTTTSTTLATDYPAQECWRSAVLQLARAHPFLLHGILASSALHLSRSLELYNEKETYLKIAARQMNIGLSQYRPVLENVTEDNAEALFSFCALTSFFTWVTAADDCKELLSSLRTGGLDWFQQDGVVGKLRATVIKLLRAVRGALVILTPCWARVSSGILSPIINRDWWPNPPRLVTPQAIEEDGKLHAIEKMWVKPGRKYEYSFDALASSLRQLREVFALVSHLTVNTSIVGDKMPTGTLIDRAAIFVWPTRISTEFISLLEQRQPESWVILAHFAILPGRIQGVWWVNCMASHIIAVAALVLGREKLDLIEWPMREVGANMSSIFSA
ncbi:uncharacterized protein BDR25DRAFT_77429 [Lindgomyces ingoldianus]|uniref:Uncharacterized protein n=1 Tax=Lindgomyces ingoldianus TaxID=673940 RepID=A0ACB6QH22_9PLEO|nr:uncharacterized protein BDR25DRAFT_77429 [Lindgomyces ingoldianus]KAF2466319.1 hypothetical protein BDR25DRAFT_77429 [Lindgomyces ingoldianus]